MAPHPIPLLAAAVDRRDLAGLAAYKLNRDSARHSVELALAHKRQAQTPAGTWAQHRDAREHRRLYQYLMRRAAHYRRNALNQLKPRT